jgi:hypothetical protein
MVDYLCKMIICFKVSMIIEDIKGKILKSSKYLTKEKTIQSDRLEKQFRQIKGSYRIWWRVGMNRVAAL